MVLGYTDEEVNRFFAKALLAVGEDWGMDELLTIVMKVGEKNLKCMALLEKDNIENYGTPVSVTVPLTVEKRPLGFLSRGTFLGAGKSYMIKGKQAEKKAENAPCGRLKCVLMAGNIKPLPTSEKRLRQG